MYIYSWNPNSEGAKALKDEMGIKKIKNEGSKFKGAGHKTVINWGSSEVPHEIEKCKILNHPDKVKKTVNKLEFFTHLNGQVWLPPFTTSHELAIGWCGEGYTVVARTILNGHSGAGIVLMDKNTEKFTKAPLYVKYIPKTEEYRIHVVLGKVIDVQRKTLSKDKLVEKNIPIEDVNWKIRNLDNCFIYQRANVNPAQEVLDAACHAVKTIGLDFGAVDIVVNKKDGKPYVLEINTAPGLQGQTVESYAKAFKG